PGTAGGPPWQLLLDTARPTDGDTEALALGTSYELAGRSLVLLCQSGEEWAVQYGRSNTPEIAPPLAPLLGGPTPEQRTISGTVVTIASFSSPQLDNQRDILVYLPPGYDEGNARYPVLYAQDGQNLFDEATSFGDEWAIDETMQALAAHNIEAIVVGIPNMGARRLEEYSPFVDAEHGGGQGDAYLAFVAETLKPHIDRSFRTQTEPAATILLGSSMGGLIALYGVVQRPEIFGTAIVLSPALWFADSAILPVIEQAAPPRGRIYLDVGTDEGENTLAHTRRLRELLLARGMSRDEQLRYHEALGDTHSEAAWASRIGDALIWVLGANNTGAAA
ncbi:alpha/beta hydrolase, partial [Candidatus Gracilibacteria bacterium]|nr:alpha/beta hydrolase [Candidatus Gracilibacteria bacterium]